MFEPRFEVKDGEQQFGPFTEDVLVQLWSESKVGQEAQYATEGTGKWYPLESRWNHPKWTPPIDFYGRVATYRVADRAKEYGPLSEDVLEMLWKQQRFGPRALYRIECSSEWWHLAQRFTPAVKAVRPVASVPEAVPVSADGRPLVKVQRSRGTFIALGLFLGAFGVHNLYAARFGVGIGQLCVTALGIVLAPPILILSAVWALLECCTVTTDGQGDPLG